MAALFDNICTLPLQADLFTQALHPTLPILSIGLSTGHVQTYRLPSLEDDSGNFAASSLSLNGGSISSLDSTSEERPAKKVKFNSVHAPGRDYSDTDLTNGLSAAAAASTAKPILSQPNRRTSVASENGLGSIESIWSTRRHKGSCRTLTFNHDGAICYSAGTDGLVKSFDSESGKVISKIAIPEVRDGRSRTEDLPTLVHALSPQGLLLATDSGRLYYHDLRQGGQEIAGKASQVWRPHGEEFVNTLVPLPASEASTSGFPKSWVSVGGSTLAVTDMRKGVLARSEDQEVELTSVCFVSGLKKGGTSVGEKICVGQADGVVSLWERGVWGDLDERVVISRWEAGIESLVELPAAEFGYGRGNLKTNEKVVACGLEDGVVRFMRIGRNGVLNEWDIKHDEIDGVVGLGFDVGGRMVSGGGNVVKVWTEAKGMPGGGRNGTASAKSSAEGGEQNGDSDGEEGWEDASDDDNAEEEKPSKPRQKRKRHKGKDKSGGRVFDFTM